MMLPAGFPVMVAPLVVPKRLWPPEEKGPERSGPGPPLVLPETIVFTRLNAPSKRGWRSPDEFRFARPPPPAPTVALSAEFRVTVTLVRLTGAPKFAMP